MSSKLCAAGDKQGKDSIQGPKAHAIPVGREGTAPRSAPLGHGSLVTSPCTYLLSKWKISLYAEYPEGKNTAWSSLQVKKNIAVSPSFSSSRPSSETQLHVDSSNDCWMGSHLAPWGLASAGANSVMGRSKKQMAQIVTQTLVSCR